MRFSSLFCHTIDASSKDTRFHTRVSQNANPENEYPIDGVNVRFFSIAQWISFFTSVFSGELTHQNFPSAVNLVSGLNSVADVRNVFVGKEWAIWR